MWQNVTAIEVGIQTHVTRRWELFLKSIVTFSVHSLFVKLHIPHPLSAGAWSSPLTDCDVQERAKEGGEVITTRRPLEENHLLQALERPRDCLQRQEVSQLRPPQERRLVTHPLHHPPTQSYLTSTPIRLSCNNQADLMTLNELTSLSCPKPTRTYLPRPPSSHRPPLTPLKRGPPTPLTPLITTRPQLLSAAPPSLATSENRQWCSFNLPLHVILLITVSLLLKTVNFLMW